MARGVIGKKIEELREGQGWTQGQLVEQLMSRTPGQSNNTMQATWNQMENGRRKMTAKYAIMLSRVFNSVSAAEWLQLQNEVDLQEAEEELAIEGTVAL